MNDVALVARSENTNSVMVPTTPVRTSGVRNRTWVPLKNEPGRFLEIPKNRLAIDPAYQRKINDRLVARIVGNWSWIACGVIEVSSRDDGNTFFIVDGQHRWAAARHLPSIFNLPCLVFDLDTVRDEAIGFLATNAERRLPSLADQFKALLVSGDKTAETMRRMADDYSRRISAPASPTTISCVSDFMRCLNANTAAMERVFPVIAELCRGRVMPGRIFRAMHGLERRMPTGESLADSRWHKRVIDVGYDQVLDSIRAITLIEHNAGERACAQGLLRAINRGLRPQNSLHANMDIVRR